MRFLGVMIVAAAVATSVLAIPKISRSFTARINLYAEYNEVPYTGNYTHYSLEDKAWMHVGQTPMDYPGNSTTLFHPPNHYTIMNPFFKRYVCATVPIAVSMKYFELDFDATYKERGIKCPRDRTRRCDHWYFMDMSDCDNDYYIYSETVDTNPILDRVVIDGENMHEEYDFLTFDPTPLPASFFEIPKTQPCANLVDDKTVARQPSLYTMPSHYAGILKPIEQNKKAPNQKTVADMLVNSPEALEMTRRNQNPAAPWKVAPASRFDGLTFRDVAKMLQAPRMRTDVRRSRRSAEKQPARRVRIAEKIPAQFDSREEWPMCNIKAIRNQGSCGSCWAFGAAEAFSDRLCIARNASAPITLSPGYMVSCYKNLFGCDGGYVDIVHEDMRDYGTVLESCMPYHGASTECIKDVCADKKTPIEFYKMREVHDVFVPFNTELNVRAIQTEIMTSGPVETAFWVFGDFMHYGGGIYTRTPGSALEGGHAVKIIGWGEENGVPYWTVANSWGESWGEGGFFRIRRGTNECDIEGDVAAGTPAV